jgi:predicted phosphodiesterase
MITLGLFSDVHGNLAALEAVLLDLRSKGVRRLYCLGDLVGYGPDPNEVIDLIQAEGIPTILGNYDDGVGFERGSCGCFYPDVEAKRIGAASYEFTVRAVADDRKEYLRGLPRDMRLQIEGYSLHLVHGSPRRINEYLLPGRETRTFERVAAAEEADILVFGHTHVSWHRIYGGVHFVNVGATGRPSDGNPRAAYTLLRLDAGQAVQVDGVRIEYDVERTAEKVLSVGLPPELAARIRHGG